MNKDQLTTDYINWYLEGDRTAEETVNWFYERKLEDSDKAEGNLYAARLALKTHKLTEKEDEFMAGYWTGVFMTALVLLIIQTL